MLVLGINGSPRKGGNTEILLDCALAGAKRAGAETLKINLGELNFSPCKSCAKAKKNGECIVIDDMQKIYSAVKNADGLILASPVYFGSISAQTKMLIDRFQCHWAAVYQHKTLKQQAERPGFFLCAEAGSQNSFFENSRFIVRNFFTTLNIKYFGGLLCTGLEAAAEVLKRKECLEKAEQEGFDLVRGYNEVHKV